jgi:hypothetical protein
MIELEHRSYNRLSLVIVAVPLTKQVPEPFLQPVRSAYTIEDFQEPHPLIRNKVSVMRSLITYD